jgi:hypothetical protein
MGVGGKPLKPDSSFLLGSARAQTPPALTSEQQVLTLTLKAKDRDLGEKICFRSHGISWDFTLETLVLDQSEQNL